ncbi:MAG TPA: hypothetical protein VKC52_06635 [Acidimicrobiia bacterium]|nr:hypothetical protein [Acidimicrobiia bacterium]
MALAILLGGIVGLLVAGGVLAVGTIRQARRDEDDINHAFAEARGEKHDRVIGPAPWSSFDMEALGEEGVSVDPSDPYATLTGVSAVSWSHSTEANGADDTPYLDDEPATQLTTEPDETFVAAPDDTFGAAPDDTFVAAPDDTFVAAPDDTFVAEPDDTFVAAPAAMLPESVGHAAAPATIEDERPVVWRAPAQSQVIILVVALRALADGVAATITPEGAAQLDGLDDALAHARGAYERGNTNGRRSSIDVGGHDRPASDVSSSSIGRDDRSPVHGSVPRRSAPPRRHNGPKRITWRAGAR